MEWRFEKEKAGTGVLGDLGVHLIDMTRLLVGDFDMLTGHTEIIVKERPWPDGSGIGQVGTDDFCTFIASMKNGATANFTISRCAIGEKNSIRFDVFGTKGVIYANDGDDYFTIKVSVSVSDQFYGWLCGLGSKVRIESPASVSEDFKVYLSKIQRLYE